MHPSDGVDALHPSSLTQTTKADIRRTLKLREDAAKEAESQAQTMVETMLLESQREADAPEQTSARGSPQAMQEGASEKGGEGQVGQAPESKPAFPDLGPDSLDQSMGSGSLHSVSVPTPEPTIAVRATSVTWRIKEVEKARALQKPLPTEVPAWDGSRRNVVPSLGIWREPSSLI